MSTTIITNTTVNSSSSGSTIVTTTPVTCSGNNVPKTNQCHHLKSVIVSNTSSSSTTNESQLSASMTAASSNHGDIAPIPQASNAHLAIGTRVIVPSLCVIGTLRFLGGTDFKPGTWAGIELDLEGAGKNNGSVQGVRYFSCPEHTGLFVPASKVAPLPNGIEDDDLDVKIHPAAFSRAKQGSHTLASITSTRSKNCCSSKRAHASPTRHTCATANQVRKGKVTTPQKQEEEEKRISPRQISPPLRKTTVPSPSKSTALGSRRRNSDEISHRRTVVPKSTVANTTRRIDGLCIPQPTRSSLVGRRNSDDGRAKRPSPGPKPTRSTATGRVSDVPPPVAQRQRQTTVPKSTAITADMKLSRRGSKEDANRTRKSAVPTVATTPSPTRRMGDEFLRRKSAVLQVVPTKSKSTTTTRQKSNVGVVSQTAMSRSSTTRRTKHTVHKPTPDEEQLRQLLEESRKEHAKLREELMGKEAAWERTLTTKESYAIQVKEQQHEMERMRTRIAELEAQQQEQRPMEDDTNYRATVEAQQQRIERLDRLVLQLQMDAEQTKQRYLSEIQTHMAQASQLQRDHDAATSALEQDYQALEQNRLQTVQHYEARHLAIQDAHHRALEMKEAELAVLRRALEKQPTVMMVEQEDVAGAEQRRRLEHQLELTTAELDRERSAHATDIQKIDAMAREIECLCQVHRDTCLKMDQLEQNLAKEIADKRQIMEEAQQTQAKLQRLQEQYDQAWLVKQKVEHDYAEAIRRAASVEQKLVVLERQHDKSWSLLEINRLSREIELQNKRYRDLEAEKMQLQEVIDKRRRRSSGIQSPVSPVSLTSFSSMFGSANAKDQLYCEICEIFGHDVLSCTAYTTATSATAGAEHDRPSTHSYCVNCDVFGAHSTEYCPNQNEMF